MTIQLTRATYVNGSLEAIGSQHTLDTATEAYFISMGMATRVGSAPNVSGSVNQAFISTDANGNTVLVGANMTLAMSHAQTALTACAIGDSISARDEGSRASGLNGARTDGVQTIAEMLLGGGIEVTGIYATGGYTIEQIAATHLPTALAAGTDLIYVRAGMNNIIGSAETGAATYAKLKSLLIDPILAAGKLCIVCTITYSADMNATMQGEMHSANNLIRALAGINRRLKIADDNAVMTSVSGVRRTAPSAAYDDNTHQNQAGGYWMATEAVRCYKEFGVLAGAGRARKPVNAYGIATNPRIAGENASGTNKTSLGTGISGTGPNGWTVNRSGTTTAVANVVARTDTLDGNAFELAITIGGAGNTCDVLPGYASGDLFIVGTGTFYQRQNSASYVEGEIRRFSNGRYYRVISAVGTSAAAEPGTLPTTVGGAVTDGTLTWICLPEFLSDPTWAMRLISDFMVTAQSGLITLQHQLVQMTAAYGVPSSGVSAYSRQTNAFETMTSALGSVYGPVGSDLTKGYDALPLNQVLTVKTPWVRFHADTRIIEPKLRITGAAGATATVHVLGMEIEIAQIA